LGERGRDKVPSRLELQSQLPKLKMDKPDSKVPQMVLHQIYSNLRSLSKLKNKGKKVGRLRFNGKGWHKTFAYNQSVFRLMKTGKRLDILHLSKIGDIPVRVHRAFEGKIKQVVIKRHNSGKWFACTCVEREMNVARRETNRAVGLDVGMKHFLTDSLGGG